MGGMAKALVLSSLCVVLSVALPAAATTPAPYSWATAPWGGGGFVDGFLYHPAVKGILYARTDVGGMYRYDYAGQKWIPLMDAFGHDDANCFGVVTMAVDVNNPDRLYATCGLYLNPQAPNAALLRSDDRGATWQKTPLPFKLGGNAMGRGDGERLQVDPANGDVLWLGTNQDGLWKSNDRGVTFVRVAGFVPKSVTVVLLAGQTIYAASGETGDGLYISHDDGQTFAPASGSPKLIPHQMALDTDGALYVTFSDGLGPHSVTDGAVWKLKSDGTWVDITPVHSDPDSHFGYSGIDIDRQHQGTVAVTSSDRYGKDDVWLSHDGGTTWTAIGPLARHHTEAWPWLVAYTDGAERGPSARQNMGHWMDGVKINPFDSNELIYGTGYGVWKTNDLGHADTGGTVNFDFADNNLEETVVLGLESPPAGPHVIAAVGDVGGAGWDDTRQGPSYLLTPEHETDQSIAFAGANPKIMARTADQAATSGYISTDGAKTWTPMPASPRIAKDADGHAHTSGKIAVSAGGTMLVWVPEAEQAYFSLDRGQTWTAAKGWPAPERGQEAIADKVDDGVFYTYDRATGVILKSRDFGAAFQPYAEGLPKLTGWDHGQLRAVPGQAGDLWLAAPGGLYHTTDGRYVSKAKDVNAAWQITFGKGAPWHVYPAIYLWGKVKGQAGLWRSDDVSGHWIRINDDTHQFGNMRAIAGDPREYGTLYIAPDGRGVMVGRPQVK